MGLRKILSLICPLVTMLCLTLGDVKMRPGMALAAGLGILGTWWLAYRWPSTWFPSIALVATVGLAVVEVCQGAAALWMLVGAALALASWDLMLMDRQPAGVSSARKLTLLEEKHYQNLLLSVGLTVAAILISRIVHFQIPFGIMILLVILAFFSLTRIWTTN